MANYADPDQLASSEANWSGSTLFAKAGSAGLGLIGYEENRILQMIHMKCKDLFSLKNKKKI